MARRNFDKFIKLWEQHEKLYVEIFEISLREMTRLSSISGNEDTVSKKLAVLTRKTCLKLQKQDKYKNKEVRPPHWELQNQPVKEEDNIKRPDFKCSYVNTNAIDEEGHEIFFDIECKLLGKPTKQGWRYNENYVTNGIKRYLCKDHAYGKRTPSGMIIGYIISQKPSEVQKEVNNYIKEIFSTLPELSFNNNTLVEKTEQLMKREEINPSEFRLLHLWVDLRNNYVSS